MAGSLASIFNAYFLNLPNDSTWIDIITYVIEHDKLIIFGIVV